MLITTTKTTVDQSNKEALIAHVIRLPLRENGPFAYFAGVSSAKGVPFGLLTTATGEVLRQWKRLSSVEDYFAILKGQIAGIYFYPTDNPEQGLREMLIRQYKLEESIDHAGLEVERKVLLEALRPAELGKDGRTSDTADA